MTISNQDARTGPYSGNGSTTEFAYDFKVIDESHLVVTLKDSSDVETVQTIVTQYTVSGVGDAGGGTVTMVTPPASGETLTLSRSVPRTQEVDLVNRGAVQPEVLETAYDKLTQQIQDQAELFARIPRFPVSSSLANVGLPLTLTAGAALRVNSTSDGFENGPTADQITSAQSYAEAAQTALDEFTDLYLGAKASDPALDNDGNALQDGALYFNTSSNDLRVYNGSAWQVAAVSVAGFLAAANDLSDVASAATARSNLGLVIGTDVQAFDSDTMKSDTSTRVTASMGFTPVTDASSSGSVTFDFSTGNISKITLSEDITSVTISGATAGDILHIQITQDSTARAISGWPAAVKWSGGGTAPTISTTSGAVDIVSALYDGTNYWASVTQDHQ
jgi:hypothetical protein